MVEEYVVRMSRMPLAGLALMYMRFIPKGSLIFKLSGVGESYLDL